MQKSYGMIFTDLIREGISLSNYTMPKIDAIGEIRQSIGNTNSKLRDLSIFSIFRKKDLIEMRGESEKDILKIKEDIEKGIQSIVLSYHPGIKNQKDATKDNCFRVGFGYNVDSFISLPKESIFTLYFNDNFDGYSPYFEIRSMDSHHLSYGVLEFFNKIDRLKKYGFNSKICTEFNTKMDPLPQITQPFKEFFRSDMRDKLSKSDFFTKIRLNCTFPLHYNERAYPYYKSDSSPKGNLNISIGGNASNNASDINFKLRINAGRKNVSLDKVRLESLEDIVDIIFS